MKTKVHMEWTKVSPARTLDALVATGPSQHFLHNNLIYAGILRLELLPEGEGTCYVVVALGASRPSRLLGSSVVTPVLPGPPIPLSLPSPRPGAPQSLLPSIGTGRGRRRGRCAAIPHRSPV